MDDNSLSLVGKVIGSTFMLMVAMFATIYSLAPPDFVKERQHLFSVLLDCDTESCREIVNKRMEYLDKVEAEYVAGH